MIPDAVLRRLEAARVAHERAQVAFAQTLVRPSAARRSGDLAQAFADLVGARVQHEAACVTAMEHVIVASPRDV